MVNKSALGKSIDMASIARRNEKVRAVGNMNVNARGDILNSPYEAINYFLNSIVNKYIILKENYRLFIKKINN